MKRAIVIAALTLAAAAPASLGLVGNASFGRDVPVRVPTSAILLDQQGSELHPTLQQTTRSANHSANSIGTTTTPATTTTRAELGDDNGGTTNRATARVEPGDDNGQRTTVTARVQPGDDNGGTTSRATARVEPGDDNGGDSNSSSASTSDDRRDGGSGKHGGKG